MAPPAISLQQKMHEDSLFFMIADDLRQRLRADGYDPVSGSGSAGPRQLVAVPEGNGMAYIPQSMVDDPAYSTVNGNFTAWQQLRIRHDFEYWCAVCAYIKPKEGFRPVHCIPNGGQRIVIEELERERLAGRPIRIIVLKARQWGCSTLIQLYIAWLQTAVHTGVNALICAHRKDTAANIRGMYSRILSLYPKHLWSADTKPKLTPYEQSSDIRLVAGRDCTLTVASCRCEDAIRGSDIALAHLSEVAYWQSSATITPEAVAQAVFGSIALGTGTMVVLESTANGVGNFFHREWIRSKNGNGGKQAVFVPWYEVEYNTAEPPDRIAFALSMDEREQNLWNRGLTLAQIYWWRCKRIEIGIDERFGAEFPSCDTEAFLASQNIVFDPEHIENLRTGCDKARMTGGISESSGKFTEDRRGRLAVWQLPERGAAYVVAVDVGGRSAGSDWSVIAIVRRRNHLDIPEVVAQWRGHTDHDTLARKAVAISRYYNNALLVVESNTFETARYGGAGDDPNPYVLAEMARNYPNMYKRRTFDSDTGQASHRYGFHTNRSTKPMLIGNLIAMVREGAYIERDHEACDEMAHYEQLPNGNYGAPPPYHDDIVMTRALALLVIATETDEAPAIEKYSQKESW